MESLNQCKFKCSSCDEIHVGIPSLGTKAPIQYFTIPEIETKERVFLTSDTCVIDDELFFVRGFLELPVIGYSENFSFGAWVSLSKENFTKFENLYEKNERENESPMFGWFSSWFYPFYESHENIKSRIHFRNHGIRPYIEFEPTQHPLAIAQAIGISDIELIKIYEYYVHNKRE